MEIAFTDKLLIKSIAFKSTDIKLMMLATLAAGSLYSMNAYSNGGILPADYPDAALINEGREIFFNETFDGNGRTCGTCHAEDNNFTIDPLSISKLPADDPLFAAERSGNNPLSENFEKPELMHKVGLILENTNGFGDLENSFTMRSVPHMLGMRTSITAPSDVANDGTSNPPDERTGWSGDGSPTNIAAGLRGTLRDFAVGAVTQHFPKTLGREAGIDFRLPTDHELDAIAAFTLSLGRQEEPADLNTYSMKDDRADRGRLNYMGAGIEGPLNCNACHFNGGANTNPNFDFPAAVTPAAFEQTNRSFRPRGGGLRDQHGDMVFAMALPDDDGFGDTGLFNTPPVIEAADTPPFFHANQIDTVEGMVAFYGTQRILRDGTILPPIVGMNGAQVVNVAFFVRVLNADENARSAIDLIDRARQIHKFKDRRTNIYLAQTEIDDALEVLNAVKLHFDDAVPLFEKAKRQLNLRRYNKAIKTLGKARDAMIDRSVL